MEAKDKYKAIRNKLGLKENELINTSQGALDVFKIEDGRIYYGFASSGITSNEPIDDFVKRFDGIISKKEISRDA